MSWIAILAILLGLAVVSWRRLSVVLSLAVLIILVFILELFGGWLFVEDLALNPLYLIDLYHFHTIFTSMFLHAGVVHLIFNLFALIFIGLTLENRIGRLRFFVIYLVAGVIGGLAWAAVHWNQWVFAIGASGAIMGTMGAFARLFGRERIRIFLFLLPLPPMPAYMVFVLLLVIDLVIALTGSILIAAEAHIGGAIAGFLIAPLVMKLPGTIRGRKETKINLFTLRELATTPELQEMLSKIEKETVPEIRLIWLNHFLERARCPKCGSRIEVRGSTLYSNCGWRGRL